MIKKNLFSTITSIVLTTVALTGLISCGGGGGGDDGGTASGNPPQTVQPPPPVIISPPPGSGGQDNPLGNFSVSLPANCPRQVELCVWDHECEDGDQIRVSVNGYVEFEGQLLNQRQCKTVSVREGRNSVQLYAINGTGGLNNCIDPPPGVNTGAMSISGSNSETKLWRHRGGAGSTANLDVTIGPSGGSCPGTTPPVNQPNPPTNQPGQPVLIFGITDGCNDGYRIDVRFFQYDSAGRVEGTWPGGRGFYHTEFYNQVQTRNLGCTAGRLVCYGAKTGNRIWGVDFDDGSGSCTSCCTRCPTSGEGRFNRRLVCR